MTSNQMSSCIHLEQSNQRIKPRTMGCEECEKMGSKWVKLRLCLACGHVGCCDSSANKHATGHFKNTGHPTMKSFEKDESWRYCYVDEITKD